MVAFLGLLSALFKAIPGLGDIAKAIDADRLRMQMYKAGQDAQRAADLEYQKVQRDEKAKSIAAINARVESLSHDDIIAELHKRVQRR